MKTDTLFYRLFLQRPELIFDLTADLTRPNKASYSFKSVEVKQAAFRIDGVFIPTDDQLEYPLIFVEVQYQKDTKIYARLISELALYLYQKAPSHNWRAVVIFPDETSDPGESEHYQEFFTSGRIQMVCLNHLPKYAQGLGVQLIQLIEIDETCVWNTGPAIFWKRNHCKTCLRQTAKRWSLKVKNNAKTIYEAKAAKH